MDQTWIVIALVQIFEYRREDFGRFVGESNALVRVEGVILQNVGKVRGAGEDVLMGGKDSLFMTDDEGDDRADAATSGETSE